jgi:hypothetical protein
VAEPDGPGAACRRPGDVPARGLCAQPPAQHHRRGLPGALRAVRPRAEAVARDAPGRRRVRVRGAALARAGARRGQRPHGQADAGLAPLRPRSAQRAARSAQRARALASASPAAPSSPAAASDARRTPRPRRAPGAAHAGRGGGGRWFWSVRQRGARPTRGCASDVGARVVRGGQGKYLLAHLHNPRRMFHKKREREEERAAFAALAAEAGGGKAPRVGGLWEDDASGE